jgi:hypothetical protein
MDAPTNSAIAVSLSKIVATAANKHSSKAHEGKTIVIVRYQHTHTRRNC